jgi:hypothetical protein
LEASSRHIKSLAARLGRDIMGSGCRCSCLVRVSTLDNMGVCFAIAKQKAFLVLGHGFIAIALETLDRDLEVMIVPFACF